jgi:hypothetical protein
MLKENVRIAENSGNGSDRRTLPRLKTAVSLDRVQHGDLTLEVFEELVGSAEGSGGS